MKKLIPLAAGIQLHIPKDGNKSDVNVPSSTVSGQSNVLDVIASVNEYLWFIIGFVCFIFLIYNGVKLVMARGEAKEFDIAKKGMLGSAVGIAICFLSYSLVRIVVNLL